MPLASRRTATLAAIAAFIAGETDDERIEKLLWGRLLIDHNQHYPKLERCLIDASPMPRCFALLKLLFLPGALHTKTEDVDIRLETAIPPLLRGPHG